MAAGRSAKGHFPLNEKAFPALYDSGIRLALAIIMCFIEKERRISYDNSIGR
jgi:hypothetical protein